MSDESRPETSSTQTGSTLYIIAFLVLQVGLPVSYYLGDEIYDERFAWRMFSTVRLTECSSKAREFERGGNIRPLELVHHLQIAWINLIERNRDEVVRRFMRRRCRQADIERVELRTICLTESGDKSVHDWRLNCQSGDIQRKDETLTSP